MILNLLKRSAVIILALIASFSASSQVVINEFCFANYSDYAVGGEFEDWVEFYNPTGAAVNIGGYWLSDNVLNPQKYQIPATVSVPANGYKLILVSGVGAYNPGFLGQTNTNFKVSQSDGEELVFSSPAGVILESYDFDIISPNQRNQSYGRVPNGTGSMVIQTNPSQGAVNAGATATGYAARPTMDFQAGYYASPISVTLSTTEVGGTIYYTTNGAQPSNTSTLYTGPISLNTTTVVRAIVYSPAATTLPSFTETNTYFFGNDNHTIPVVSISGTTLDGGWNGDELTHLEFFQNGTFTVETSGDSNEHGNDSNAYGQRGFDYVTRDALGYNHEIEYPMLHTSDRQSYQRLIFKAAANDNYPFSNGGAHIRDAYVCELSILADLHLDERKTRSCILYINGQYWGVYEIREKVDDTDYTDYYYDQPAGNVDFLKTWGGTWTEYAAAPGFNPQTQWNTFVNFTTTNSMVNQANYDYVVSQFNTMSLIDYFILNGYTVCTDWLNWNTAWWKGTNPNGDAKRWRYALWDNDNTFGHGANYTGVNSTQPTSDPCQIENEGNIGGQGHIPVLNALFDNPEFFADYIQRYAELSNTIFSCERMIEVLDSMILVIEPEMPRQIQRWGGNINTWNNNVQEVRDFILARCNNSIIDGIVDCYDVVPYNVTFQIDGVGDIIIGETEISPYEAPYSGTYFGDLEIDLEAIIDFVVGPCSSFQGWEIISGTGIIADPTAPITTLIVQSDVTVQAIFGIPASGPVTVVSDVFPAGAGNIVFNGTPQITYPETFSVNAGDSTTVSVTANPWFTFNHWESTTATLLPNTTTTSIYLNPCAADTLVAIFDETPHAILQVDVMPVGAGTVTMDGTVLAAYPWNNEILADVDYSFNANEIPGVTLFDHWEINNHPLAPNTLTPDVILHLMVSDTLVAVFTIIDEFPLTVDVQPAGAGTVTMNGNPWTPLPSTQIFAENTFMNFVASPIDSWTAFNHWEINNHVLAPNISSTNVNFNFTEEDTLVAVFDVTPHHPLTVIVNPATAGTVLFDTGNATTTMLTIENEDNVSVNFTAIPEPYWMFTGWQSVAGTPINPNLTADQVSASFNTTDTIIANFSKEPFLYYVPNTFSPNDDNLNEVFIPVLNAYDPSDYYFGIYDRWGIMIFETNDPEKGWNGTFDGNGSHYVPNDAYVWKLRVKPIGGREPLELMGTLTLFR
ncbi:MAG: CotH kinase family protein [Flavobacteriales bacterium]|nr:CotH kinase family protein [Flavobacteriales bacterium]MDP4819001.1 CotH kinase family protein [Flavobacteriales bacterium]